MGKIENLIENQLDFLIKDLNKQQKEAVKLPVEGHSLVLAGAGSGKTKVLTNRIIWLNLCHQIPTNSICALTFTNKAAKEMNERIQLLSKNYHSGLWCGTFHSINHRFLRMHYEQANLSKSFQILDSEDQLSLVRRVIKDLNYNPKNITPKSSVGFINAHKDEGLRPQDITAENQWQEIHLTIYDRYNEVCYNNHLVDFAEIILRACETFKNNPSLLAQYQGRFSHLLVDEFQDTNNIQYQWVKILNGQEGNTFIVGDDDQSIYGWRGAQIENIQKFSAEFGQLKPVREIRLEQNYRSTKHILECANQLISKNKDRLGKNLWTESDKGNLVFIHFANNDKAETDFVINNIESYLEQGLLGQEIAILYRSNAQSRLFEEALLRAKIPYQIYGGYRFFERAEIKDMLAYLRILSSTSDNPAFLRIINHPPRGIGIKSVDQIVEYANQHNISYFNALSANSQTSVQKFIELINNWKKQCNGLTVSEQLDFIYKNSQLVDYYKNESLEKAEIREQNIKELIVAANDYENAEELIAHAALEANEEPKKGQAIPEECIQLMTIHSSKGLEFSTVFMVGMEDGIFPSQRSIENEAKLAEERRLAYVGLTRAREQLYLTFAGYRQLYGKQFNSFPVSRFLLDLPEEHIKTLED